MQVTEEMLDKMAKLARLNIDPSQRAILLQEMTDIMGWVEELNEVDTSDVEPLIHMSQEINKFRPDVVDGQLSQPEALTNAPKSDGTFFQVPKVIDPSNG